MDTESTSARIDRFAMSRTVRRFVALLAVAACASVSLGFDPVRSVLVSLAIDEQSVESKSTGGRTADREESLAASAASEASGPITGYPSYTLAAIGPLPYSIGDMLARAER